LLLDGRGTVWITDFGLAKAVASPDSPGEAELTSTGDIVGTLRYLAPERLNGDADPRSDVYSLGLTLYEFLTLRPALYEPDRTKLRQPRTRPTPGFMTPWWPRPAPPAAAARPVNDSTVCKRSMKRPPWHEN